MAIHQLRAKVDRRDLGYVRMWRDDLAEVIQIVERGGSHTGEVQIENDDYRFGSIDDLAQVRDGRISDLKLISDNGGIEVMIGPGRCSVEVHEPDMQTRSMMAELERFFRLHEIGEIARWRTVLYTRTRAEAPTFWQRKKDDIWIEAVVAAVSLIIGGVVGYWINTIT